MKKDYERPIIEVVKFQETGIETASSNSTIDFGVGDWFDEED